MELTLGKAILIRIAPHNRVFVFLDREVKTLEEYKQMLGNFLIQGTKSFFNSKILRDSLPPNFILNRGNFFQCMEGVV